MPEINISKENKKYLAIIQCGASSVFPVVLQSWRHPKDIILLLVILCTSWQRYCSHTCTRTYTYTYIWRRTHTAPLENSRFLTTIICYERVKLWAILSECELIKHNSISISGQQLRYLLEKILEKLTHQNIKLTWALDEPTESYKKLCP